MKEEPNHNAAIPAELMLISNAASLATGVVNSRTREEREKAIVAVAILYGNEEKLRCYLTDKTVSQEAKTLASQILTSLHPGPYDFVPVIRVPWEKYLTKQIVLTLAEKSVAAAARVISTNLNHQFVSEAIGYGRILADGEANLANLGDRGEYLLECCRRIEEARMKENRDANIGYQPLPGHDDKQMWFNF